jgi:D-serine deaminase-like pyridoxal phosphate-dependent protein
MEHNIETLAEHFKTADVQWRPHMKGIRIPGIAHQALAAGAIGVTCATLGEAEAMAKAGITDILIANQVVGSRKVTRLVNLSKYADVEIAVDNEENILELSQAACAGEIEISVLLDINVGMDRTGILPGDEVLTLSHLVHQTPGLRFMGLMAWEGHTLDHSDPETRRREITKCMNLLLEIADRCRADGLPVSIVSGGGSGTYRVTSFLKGMTEIQAGGAIFCDVAYQSWDVETTPSLFVQTIVTSRPAPDRITFDAGFKTMPTWEAQPRAIGLEGVKTHVTSAEHGVVGLHEANNAVKVGDLFDFVVGYTDTTLFLHDKLYGMRNGVVEVVWDIV